MRRKRDDQWNELVTARQELERLVRELATAPTDKVLKARIVFARQAVAELIEAWNGTGWHVPTTSPKR
jgi:hypothetical protein